MTVLQKLLAVRWFCTLGIVWWTTVAKDWPWQSCEWCSMAHSHVRRSWTGCQVYTTSSAAGAQCWSLIYLLT